MKKILTLIILLIVFGLSGCATSTTQYKEELYPKLRNCRTKPCLQSYGLIKIYSYVNQQGQYVETYRLPEKQHDASFTARQAGHLVMIFATLGLWEIAYYPIEDSLELNTFTVDAIYQHPSYIKKIEIHNDAGGIIR